MSDELDPAGKAALDKVFALRDMVQAASEYLTDGCYYHKAALCMEKVVEDATAIAKQLRTLDAPLTAALRAKLERANKK